MTTDRSQAEQPEAQVQQLSQLHQLDDEAQRELLCHHLRPGSSNFNHLHCEDFVDPTPVVKHFR